MKDSNVVSVLSCAAGVTSLVNVKRWSGIQNAKVELPFPQAFAVYNKTMGGVDLHDQHVNHLRIRIKSRKWTWNVFLRLIEASISNAYRDK